MEDTFARMDLQEIREFFLTGNNPRKLETDSYDKRLRDGTEPIHSRLVQYFTDKMEREYATSELADALGVYSDVYMEIGMKAGARIVYQLLLTDDYPAPREGSAT
jgi:hypothetical protein